MLVLDDEEEEDIRLYDSCAGFPSLVDESVAAATSMEEHEGMLALHMEKVTANRKSSGIDPTGKLPELYNRRDSTAPPSLHRSEPRMKIPGTPAIQPGQYVAKMSRKAGEGKESYFHDVEIQVRGHAYARACMQISRFVAYLSPLCRCTRRNGPISSICTIRPRR